MHLNRMVIPALALILGVSAAGPAWAHGGSMDPAAYGQDGRWDIPPREFNALQRQGFADGVEGARKDYDNHRQPNVENRDEYRNPHLAPEQREAYRDGFRRGYAVGVSHLMGGAPMGGPPMAAPMPPPPPPMRGDWNTAPTEFNDVQRQGFMDGMEGARRDFDNHRAPDVNNRDEYRHPHVPPGLRQAYRDGFRRGYNRAAAHLMGRPWHY